MNGGRKDTSTPLSLSQTGASGTTTKFTPAQRAVLERKQLTPTQIEEMEAYITSVHKAMEKPRTLRLSPIYTVCTEVALATNVPVETVR